MRATGISAGDEALKAPLVTSPASARVGHRAQEFEKKEDAVGEKQEESNIEAGTCVGRSLLIREEELAKGDAERGGSEYVCG